MKNFLSLMMVVFLSLFVVPTPVSASTEEIFSFDLKKDQVISGQSVCVVLSAQEISSSQAIAGFRVALQYSSDVLIFDRVETTSQIKSGTFRYTDWGNELAGTYVCDGKSSTKLSGECISFFFSVRENVSGNTQISASLYDVVDWEGNSLAKNSDNLLSVKISPPSSSSSSSSSRADDEEEASLIQIEPSAGTLSPDFSPDIHRYDLEVDASVSSIDFYLPVEDGSAKASRKTLLAAGLDTWITITVKNSSGKSQEDYLIIVHRQEASEDSSTSSLDDQDESSESSVLESSAFLASAGGTSSRRPSSQQPSSRASSSQRTSSSDSASASRLPTAGFTENPPPADTVYRPSGEDVTVYGDRSLYVEESQFSPFLLGICTALACMGVGALVFPFFKKD